MPTQTDLIRGILQLYDAILTELNKNEDNPAHSNIAALLVIAIQLSDLGVILEEKR